MTDWKRIQQRLNTLNFKAGPNDGIPGTKTRTALRQFQRANGLTATGKFDRKTQAELFPATIKERNKDFIIPRPMVNRGSWPRQKNVPNFYGPVGQNQVFIDPPYPMVLAWDKSHKVRRIQLHRKVAPSAERVLKRVAAHYTPAEIIENGFHLFGGSLNVRKMRGGSRYSMHSWGIAIDFDPARNSLRSKRHNAHLARPECEAFWRFWEEEGWVSLGRTRNFDWMHVQAARL